MDPQQVNQPEIVAFLIEKSKTYYHQWQLKNRDKIKEYNKRNYEKRKASLNAPIICECGLSSITKHLSRHQQSQRHKDLMASKKN